MDEVVRAINHVHKDVDTQNQWTRAVKGMRGLTNLEVGRVWVKLSSQACKLDTADAIILHSQLLELFRLCVDEAKTKERLDLPECSFISDETVKVLEQCKRALMHNNAVFGSMHTRRRRRTGSLEEVSDSESEESKKIDSESGDDHTTTMQIPESALQSTLSSLEFKIGNVQAKLSKHESSLDEIIGNVSSLAELAKSIPDEITRKKEQMDLASEIQHMLDAVDQQHTAQAARYSEFKKQATEVRTEYEQLFSLNIEMHKEFRETHDHFLGRIDSLKKEITEVSQTMVGIPKMFSEFNTVVSEDLESLHLQYDALQSEMQAKFDGTDNTNTLKEHEEKMKQLEKSVLEAQGQVRTLNTYTQQETNTIKDRMNDVMRHIEHHEQQTGAIKSTPALKRFPPESTVDETSFPAASVQVKKSNTKPS
jgi:chromosome segregation ATPase